MEVLLLLYADDLIIISLSHHDMQDKVSTLNKYCESNNLMVNPAKSSILKFCRGRPKREKAFTCNGKPIKLLQEVRYLGIKMSKSGLFLMAAEEAVSKTNIARCMVREMWSKVKQGLGTKQKLCHSIIMSLLLYGAGIWGLSYTDLLKKSHLTFIKKLFLISGSGHNFWQPRPS